MRNIKHALTERFYAWEDAQKLARSDPEIRLEEGRAVYTPSDYIDAEETEGYEEEDSRQAKQVSEST
jgi:large subunit ribosomal protein L47